MALRPPPASATIRRAGMAAAAARTPVGVADAGSGCRLGVCGISDCPVRVLAGGRGRVLDVGAGSGRTAIMLSRARPLVQLTALDVFSGLYINDNSPELLTRNLRTAGIAPGRVHIVTADMRQMPLANGEFDGVVSTYAIDHLNRRGREQALREVARVLRPQGEFLLAVIQSDLWLKFVYGPLLLHHGFPPREYWCRALPEAGFQIEEEGTTPGSIHFLCRRR
jgi:SAM-dependent methyltransferase